jgi:hypothetical protein
MGPRPRRPVPRSAQCRAVVPRTASGPAEQLAHDRPRERRPARSAGREDLRSRVSKAGAGEGSSTHSRERAFACVRSGRGLLGPMGCASPLGGQPCASALPRVSPFLLLV